MTTRRFKVGDYISRNSEAGRVTRHITRVMTSENEFKGYAVHPGPEEPQHEIASDTTPAPAGSGLPSTGHRATYVMYRTMIPTGAMRHHCQNVAIDASEDADDKAIEMTLPIGCRA